MEEKYKTISYLLGVILLVVVVSFISDWSNKAENTKYKQGLVDNYDSFYSDCVDYLNEKNIPKEQDAKTLDAILYGVETRSQTCKELNEFSKRESKQVIYDIFYPEKEHITKDCDGRGCVYSN